MGSIPSGVDWEIVEIASEAKTNVTIQGNISMPLSSTSDECLSVQVGNHTLASIGSGDNEIFVSGFPGAPSRLPGAVGGSFNYQIHPIVLRVEPSQPNYVVIVLHDETHSSSIDLKFDAASQVSMRTVASGQSQCITHLSEFEGSATETPAYTEVNGLTRSFNVSHALYGWFAASSDGPFDFAVRSSTQEKWRVNDANAADGKLVIDRETGTYTAVLAKASGTSVRAGFVAFDLPSELELQVSKALEN